MTQVTVFPYALQIKKKRLLMSLTRKAPIFICYLSSIPIYVPKKTRIYTQPLVKKRNHHHLQKVCHVETDIYFTLPKTNRAPEILMVGVGSDDI